jgi:hypothetical protein
MIKRNELRLGNFVQHDHEGTLKIISIGASCFGSRNAEYYNFVFHYADVEGIPLTPELLEAAGFKFEKNDGGLQCERGGVYWQLWTGANGSDIPFSVDAGAWSYSNFEIIGKGAEYLHQLQNLYFALTGEELEIKDL